MAGSVQVARVTLGTAPPGYVQVSRLAMTVSPGGQIQVARVTMGASDGGAIQVAAVSMSSSSAQPYLSRSGGSWVARQLLTRTQAGGWA